MAEGENVVRLVYFDPDMAVIRAAAGILGIPIKHFSQDIVLREAHRVVTEFQNRPLNRGADS